MVRYYCGPRRIGNSILLCGKKEGQFPQHFMVGGVYIVMSKCTVSAIFLVCSFIFIFACAFIFVNLVFLHLFSLSNFFSRTVFCSIFFFSSSHFLSVCFMSVNDIRHIGNTVKCILWNLGKHAAQYSGVDGGRSAG